jgi:hypothetical protein
MDDTVICPHVQRATPILPMVLWGTFPHRPNWSRAGARNGLFGECDLLYCPHANVETSILGS